MVEIRRRKPQATHDTFLLNGTRQRSFTIRDLLDASPAVFGVTGSGKSSSSGKLIALAIAANEYSGKAGVICVVKPRTPLKNAKRKG